MIKCEKGLAHFDGDVLQLSAETTTLLIGLLTTYSDNDGGNPKTRDFHNHLLKSVMYVFSRHAHKMGYSIDFSEKELESFERIYREVYDDGED